MATILQRVLQTITPYTTWGKAIPTNENESQASPTTEKMSNSPISAPSYRDDIKSFGERMMTHIQSGALTLDILNKALQERASRATNKIEQKKQEASAEVDREIEAVYQPLPESQRQRFTENVDRQTRIDAKFNTSWSEIFKPEKSGRFSWQTDLIAKLLQDQELEQLATSIRAKEHPMGYITVNQSKMDPYASIPLGGPLFVLRVQQAAKNPATLQAFVSNIIAGNRGIWGGDEYIPEGNSAMWTNGTSGFMPTISPQEDAYIVNALLKTEYSADDISGIICNALIAAKLPVSELEKYKLYVAQLSPDDLAAIKKYYVQAFAQIHVIKTAAPIDALAFFYIESFLANTSFVSDIPRKQFPWPKCDIDFSAGLNPLADILLQGYDINAAVPILEAYQRSRALDGSLSSTEMVSDVRACLNERTTKTPTTLKTNLDLQLN